MKFGKRFFTFMLIALLLTALLPVTGFAENIALESPEPSDDTSTKTESIFSKISTRLVFIASGVLCAVVGAGVITVILVRQSRDKRNNDAEKREKSVLDDLNDPNMVSTLPDPRQWDGPAQVYRPSDSGLLLFLCCRGGYQDGKEYPLNPEIGDNSGVKVVTIGRALDSDIKYPDNWPGISRHHVIVKIYRGSGKSRVELTDVSSTETYMKKGSRGENKANPLPKNTPVELEPGDVFYLASPDNRFELVERACGGIC